VAHLLKEAKIDHRLVLPYNPRANGVAEAWVKTIKNAVYKRLEGAKADWEDYLPAVQLAVNCKHSNLHGSRPFSLMFARQLNDFQDYSKVESASSKPNSENSNRILKRIKDMSNVVFPVIKERVLARQALQQQKFNSTHNVREEPYPVGTVVMLEVPSTNISSGSDPLYTGPFTIHSITKNHNYVLKDQEDNIGKAVPINRLKLAGADPNEAKYDSSNVYEVQAVINHKDQDGKRLYRVQWRGYPDPEADTWEPVESFHSRDAIQDYWKRRKEGQPSSKTKGNTNTQGSNKRTKVVATGSNLTPVAETELARNKRQRVIRGPRDGVTN
jgi:hypothetical protein